MAKIPDDIKDGIKQLSDVTEIPTKELVQQLKSIIETDENIQAMGDSEKEEEFKIRFAWALLYRQHSMTGNAEDFYLTPINVPRPRRIEVKGEPTYVGDLVALVQKIEKDEKGNEQLSDVTYGAGTFWRDGAKNLSKLEQGNVYKTKLIGKKNDWGITISSDRATFTKANHKMPDFDSFYKEQIEPLDIDITLGSMDLSGSNNETEIRTMQVTVIESDVGKSAAGREYGRYVVMDSSVMGGNFAIFVSPEEVVWSQGSILKFGGTIQINEDTGEIRWTNHFIVPTDLAMPKEITVKAVGGEEVDVSKPEESKEEKPKEKSKEEPKEEPKKKGEKPKEDDDGDFEI